MTTRLEMVTKACKVTPEQADKTKEMSERIAKEIAKIFEEEDADTIMMSIAMAHVATTLEAGLVAAICKNGEYPRAAIRERVQTLYDSVFKVLREELAWLDRSQGDA